MPPIQQSITPTTIHRFNGGTLTPAEETLATEEPLEIQLTHGAESDRTTQPISVTMRTPGDDAALAAGFLYTEGVVRDASGIDSITTLSPNTIRVDLLPHIEVSLGTLQRNFYTTSSCGICGKASLLALRSVSPPRRQNAFCIDAETLYSLSEKLLSAQAVFAATGGLHGAALFTAEGVLHSIREDIGRHNAVDKLIGAALLADELPLRDHVLLLSGRASFELLQKAVMAGIPMVAAVGAPSSLAVQVAREFDVTLIGFLRGNRCNVYHGYERIRPSSAERHSPTLDTPRAD